MTTIIARKVDDAIDLAFDSMATDTARSGSWHMQQRKVVAKGGIIIGIAGPVRALNLAATVKDYGDTIENAVEVFRSVLRGGGCIKYQDGVETWDGEAVIILGDVIYEIDDEFSWIEDVSGIAAIGSGAAFARGALAAGASIKRAIEVAAELDHYTGGALFITDTERIKKPWVNHQAVAA